MRAKSVPPDHLRCKRTDGRQWRCKRLAADGKALCEIHHLQGKHRQNKKKVPEYLKLERRVAIKKKATKGKKKKRAGEKKDGKRRAESKVVQESEALDEVLRRMRFKPGDLHLDLIRVFLKRQVEKKKEKDTGKVENESCDGDEEDETKILPYGVMSISRSKVIDSGQNGGLDVKLGMESNGDSCLMRSFRSKNIEPLPVGTMQAVPFAEMIKKKMKKKKCHWCRGTEYRALVKCLTCKIRFFCAGCIKERKFTKQEVKLKCPSCHGNCGCKLCLKQKQGANRQKIRSEKMAGRNQLLLYLVYLLLPVLKMINRVKSELGAEDAKVTGNEKSEIQAKTSSFIALSLSCGRCGTSIVDCHRTCTKCLYNLCLSCCRELPQHNTTENFTLRNCKRRKTHSSSDETASDKNRLKKSSVITPSPTVFSSRTWEKDEDGTIRCAPTDMGGCGDGILDLRFIFPSTWTRDLQVRAEELLSSYCFPVTTDGSSSCSVCDKLDDRDAKVVLQREPCGRDMGSSLYCPTMKDLHHESLEHFQNHWGKGHPVVVRDVLQSTEDLCWDPFTMFCSYMEAKSSVSSDEDGANSMNGLDWCEVHIDRRRIFMGSLEKKTHASIQRKVVKFKAWLSSQLFEKQFPGHYSKILSCLPLPDYAHPVSGLLNVCTKFPEELQKPDLGPCICFSFGAPEDLMQADYLSNLSYESHDTVNILAYATDVPVSTEQVNKVEDIMKRNKSRSTLEGNEEKMRSLSVADDSDESDFEEGIFCCGSVEKSEDFEEYLQAEDTASSASGNSCGAMWDIFARQDVPKLEEYIRRHSSELRSTCHYSKLAHPILDQNIFLDAYHILKLKREFDIQPWTFEQCSGEAIFVPAGCPYQIRKVKSCVNVVLNFISPENAAHCVQLNEEIRLLPTGHKSKTKVLEVEKMAVHGISAAMEDICKLTPAESKPVTSA